jgi:hypothetical protein
MQNKEFKRIWEKEGRRLFAIEKKKAMDQHKIAIGQQKSTVKKVSSIDNDINKDAKKTYKRAPKQKRKFKEFKNVW